MPFYGQGVPTAISVASYQPMYPIEQPHPQAHHQQLYAPQQQFYAPQPLAFNDQTHAHVTSPPPHHGPPQP
jgi:hypothetical protein